MQNQRDHRKTETVATGVYLTFGKRQNGRMVAVWDGHGILLDTIYMVGCVEPGATVQCDVLRVGTGDGYLLTATPTETVKRSLQVAGKWPPGDKVLRLRFAMKPDLSGAFAIEPFTGKRVYPDRGVRVWVNLEADYLCYERGRIVIARPVEEPARVPRDASDPKAPHTYREPNRDSGRRNRDARARSGNRPAQKPAEAVAAAKPAEQANKPKPEGRKTLARGTIADQLLEQGLVKK